MGKGCKALALGALLVTPLLADAALVDRGGGLIYDTTLNITWLQDANYAKTSGYDSDGRMRWPTAKAWADSLSFGGYNDWRLPTIIDTGAPGCDYSFSGTDCGFNVDPSTSEMASLWYGTLGNKGQYTTGGFAQPGWGFANTGPFINAQSDLYWSSTEYAPVPGDVWVFITHTGGQNAYGDLSEIYAWAVRDGDVVPAVPLPAAAWLLLSGLAGLGFLGRRNRH